MRSFNSAGKLISSSREFKAFIASFTSSASNGTDGAPPSRDARGPRLVQLEFVKRLHRDDKTALRGQLVPLVEQYIVTFGSKVRVSPPLRCNAE